MINYPLIILSRLTKQIDRFNDSFTSYRLVLYTLLAFLGWSVVGSFFNQVPFSWHVILTSAGWLVAVCWLINKLLSKLLNIPANNESDLITALILALILNPASTLNDYLILAAAGAVAIASKYLITFNRSHVFNPAAAGAVVSGAVFNNYASWWVGTKFVVPLVIIGGILILRKMKRFVMTIVFLGVFCDILVWQLPGSSSTDAIHHLLWLSFISTALFFFTAIMLTEPLTSPTKLNQQIIYAIAVGVLYSTNKLHISPEESLLIGNVLAFAISPRHRYKLAFIGKSKDAADIYSYAFEKPKDFSYKAGQYMEWTIAQNKSDSRGNRRYLSLSSAPTENNLMFTIKHPKDASAFKQKLDSLQPGDSILASYLAGSFTLHPEPRKLVFLAGGVGITPFRSMIKQFVDKNQSLDAVLLYSVVKPEEIAFRSTFAQAAKLGLRTYYGNLIDKNAIVAKVPDYQDRYFYISGPYGFVQAMEEVLLELGVGAGQIVTDYFPGYGG